MSRSRKSRIYWKNGRAYADFRDFARWGGRQEALIGKDARTATKHVDEAMRLCAARMADLEEARRLYPEGLPEFDPLDAIATFIGHHVVCLEKRRRRGRALDPNTVKKQKHQLIHAADGLRHEFLEAYRTDAELRFRLVINFTPWGELAELVGLQERSVSERDRIATRFRTLIKRLGGSAKEADGLLARMVLEPLLEEDLRRRTRAALADATGAADVRALEALEAILAAQVLQWAAERETVGAPEVLEALRTAVEGMQRAERYQAAEHRGVGPVEYTPDAAPSDFFAGKRVRVGHIVEGLDVRRPRWLDKIDTAMSTVPVCVVRAPSGHGKSTLAFRCAVERWPASQLC